MATFWLSLAVCSVSLYCLSHSYSLLSLSAFFFLSLSLSSMLFIPFLVSFEFPFLYFSFTALIQCCSICYVGPQLMPDISNPRNTDCDVIISKSFFWRIVKPFYKVNISLYLQWLFFFPAYSVVQFVQHVTQHLQQCRYFLSPDISNRVFSETFARLKYPYHIQINRTVNVW